MQADSSGHPGTGAGGGAAFQEAPLRHPGELFDLSGRCAVVTGASSGIGRRAALVLAQAGARVLLVARRGERLQALAQQQPHLAERLHPLPLDLNEPAAAACVAERALAELGGCDILVGAAGVAGRMDGDAVEAARFDRVLHFNVTLQASGCGRVIYVASIYGLRGQEIGPLGPYVASKHALVGLARSQAVEWAGTGITVNALAPGHFPTEMVESLLADPSVAPRLLQRYPLGRYGRLEELDTALLFLASPASSFVSGIVLPVDGGWTSR